MSASTRSPPAPSSSTRATTTSPGKPSSAPRSTTPPPPTTSSGRAPPGSRPILGISNKIALGQAEVGIGGGVDSASDAPIVVSERLRRSLLALNRARTVQQRLAIVAKIRPADLAPVAPDVAEPRTGLSMGEHQALTTAQWGISRADAGRPRARLPPQPRGGLRARLLRRPDDPLPQTRPRRVTPARHLAREAGRAEARLRQARHRPCVHDRRQLDTPLRRCLRRPPRLRRVDRAARSHAAGVRRRRRDGRR